MGPGDAGMVRTVLIVDDDGDIRALLRAFLADRPGVRVLEAVDAFCAIDVILKERLDLIITDLNMPSMSGLELIAFIRSHEPTRQTTVVLFTTERERATRRKALALGTNVFVNKPFDPVQVGQVLLGLLPG